MLKFFLIFIYLNPFSSLANEQPEQSLDILKQKETLEKIDREIGEVQKYIEQIGDREKKIYEYKIKFSDLITNFATDSSYKLEFQKNKKELLDLESETILWFEEAQIKNDRIIDLTSVLEQLNSSYVEAIKKLKSDDKRELLSLSATTKSLKKKLKVLAGQVKKHLDFLKISKSDTDKWKDFLINRIKKDLNKSLWQWELNIIFSQPIKSFISFKEKILETTNQIDQFEFLNFLLTNTGVIVVRLILSFIGVVFLLFMANIVQDWVQGEAQRFLDGSFLTVLNLLLGEKLVLCLFPLLILLPSSLGPLSFTEYPLLGGYLLTVFLLTIFWIRIAYPIITLFFKELNRSQNGRQTVKLRLLPVLIFIISKSFQSIFSVEDDFLTFFNNFLLAWMSYKIFLLSAKFRFENQKYDFKKLKNFFNSAKLFVGFFAMALLGSSILEVVGYKNLGRSIQLVVLSNILYFAMGWVIYQVITYALEWQESKIKRNNDKKKEIFKFLKSILNFSFIFALVIVVTQSWYKTIFVFGDFWNIAIFTVGDYRFTIDKPAKLIIAYFISRLLYIIVTYSLEATILNRLNISKKYSSNVTSIIRYIFIMSFFGFCAAILGMTYKNLVIFASALGVGIGFGLQNIVNNFISGVILLFEQPIRVGDIIEVNDYFAKVKHIGIRSTIVESLDNSSIIIPNSEILSNKLTNWTFNNNIIAIVCDVGVSYDSNTQLVANLLDQVAKESPDVLTSPPHQVWFNEFGDSSLNFKLKVWINRPVEKFIIHSRLMHAIFNILNENQIVIPFPQRDLHIKSDETKLI